MVFAMFSEVPQEAIFDVGAADIESEGDYLCGARCAEGTGGEDVF